MTVTPTTSYPSGPITPHGAYYLLKGSIPEVTLRAYDDSVAFHIMGGRSIPNRTEPESVQLKRGTLKGLIPPWQMIDQKTATQDGVTFLDALYDPTEVEMTLIVRGRDAVHTRQVVRDLIASLDAKEKCELSWFTHEQGRWWAPVRWHKTVTTSMSGAYPTQIQELDLRLRADDSFWRTYDNTDQFRFVYEDDIDTFNYATETGLGTGWDIAYSGSGGGYVYANGSQAVWADDPENPILPDGRDVVCRRHGFTTETDNQVIHMVLGTFQEWAFPDASYNDLWGRVATTGTVGANGVRLRIGNGWAQLSAIVGGTETVLRKEILWIPPMPGESWDLICGYEGQPRKFTVLRNGAEVFSVVETGTTSLLGSGYRGTGFGMHAGGAIITQATPAAVRKVSFGDNATVAQSGFLNRSNCGDQPMWDRFTLFGPGMFRLGNGPDSTDYVEFGPLLPNQVVQIRTDPRKRQVVDLTSTPPTPQELDWFQKALKDFFDWASGNNVPPLYQAIESQYGIVPPQGNLYSLMKGRFSKPIPAKSPGNPVRPYHVAVSIEGGNADSKIVAAGTPLRRYPA